MYTHFLDIPTHCIALEADKIHAAHELKVNILLYNYSNVYT